MQRFLIVLFALVPAFAQSTADVDKLFAQFDKHDSPGCAVAVIRDGRILYKHGYGMADLDHDVPITPSSVFHVASISKQFTATAIVLLLQEGKISLDDPVRKYVPEIPDFGVPITLRHLLHHISGLRDQWELLGLAGWRYSLDLITDDDVLWLVSRQKEVNRPPGEEYMYCNTGYTLLAQVVKRVSGKSLREFTTERIFKPLGMTSTHFRDDHAEIVKNQAYGYAPWFLTFRLSVTNFDTVGATSLLTTVEDLAAWDRNFYDQRVGGPTFRDQMLQRGRLNNGHTLDYAFGLQVTKYKGLDVVDHAGSDAGYRAGLLRFPAQHFSSACLCNAANANPSGINRHIADIYLAKELKQPPANPGPARPSRRERTPDVKLSASELGAFAGVYRSEEIEAVYRLSVEDGKLILNRMKSKPVELTPTGHDQFRIPMQGQTTARFVRDGSGRVTEVSLNMGRIRNFRMKRSEK